MSLLIFSEENELFFTKKRKKDQAKLARFIKNSLTVQEYHRDSYTLKNLTQGTVLGDFPIVVSLTSYSDRIYDVYLVLESIAQQTVKPNRVILWIAENEFSSYDLPETLKKRFSYGLEVRFCPDIRSYKKLIPTLELCDNSVIITLDDDIIYPHDTIENLIKEHKRYPNAILGNRAHEITFRNGKLKPYKTWNKEVSKQSDYIFLTGCGAILYPPNSLHASVMDSSLFMSLCPHADDVWFFIMAKLQNTEIRKAKGRCFEQFTQIPNSQDIGLNKLNVDNGGNDIQIKNVLEYFNYQIK
ncbi:glycosyltransferase family A protein [Vibrio cholerae]